MRERERTPAPFARGQSVEVREQNIRPWAGTVLSVKWSPRSGWWLEVTDDDHGTWVVQAGDVGGVG